MSHPHRITSAVWKTVHSGPVRPVPGTDQRSSTDDQKIKETYQKGYADGTAGARAHLEAQVSEAVERISAKIGELGLMPQQIREASVQNIVSLAIATASRILNREITIDPEAIQGLVLAAIEKMQTRDLHRVKLHPSHEQQVRKALAQVWPGNTIEVMADATLKPGDIIFETQQGHIDASITTQLREIERGLADRLIS